MAEPENRDADGEGAPPGLILWSLVLGASGIVAGIFGPAKFHPDMAQNPVAALIVTAPIAVLFGWLLGQAVRRSGLAARLQWQVLFGCAGALMFATLYFCAGN